MKTLKRPHSDSGAGLVETALVLPVILLLLVGVYYVSMMMHAQALLTNIAQEGSRYMARKGGLELETKSSVIVNLSTATDLGSSNLGNHQPTHEYMQRLFLAMNERDRKFLIQNINMSTTVVREVDTTGMEHKRAEVHLLVDIIPDGFLPVSMLRTIGIFPMKVSTSSRHPYMSG